MDAKDVPCPLASQETINAEFAKGFAAHFSRMSVSDSMQRIFRDAFSIGWQSAEKYHMQLLVDGAIR